MNSSAAQLLCRVAMAVKSDVGLWNPSTVSHLHAYSARTGYVVSMMRVNSRSKLQMAREAEVVWSPTEMQDFVGVRMLTWLA